LRKSGDLIISRFIIGGVLNTTVTYVVYLGLLSLLPYISAYTITYLVGISVGYFVNARFVFKKPKNIKSAAAYPLACMINYVVSIGIFWSLVNWIYIPKEFAPLLVLVITTPLMYLIAKVIFLGRLIDK
jgi:putative flippase GtrA